MPEMTEQQIADGWHEANISRVVADMIRYRLVPAEVELAYQKAIMPAMVNQPTTSIFPSVGYKVAGE